MTERTGRKGQRSVTLIYEYLGSAHAMVLMVVDGRIEYRCPMCGAELQPQRSVTDADVAGDKCPGPRVFRVGKDNGCEATSEP